MRFIPVNRRRLGLCLHTNFILSLLICFFAAYPNPHAFATPQTRGAFLPRTDAQCISLPNAGGVKVSNNFAFSAHFMQIDCQMEKVNFFADINCSER